MVALMEEEPFALITARRRTREPTIRTGAVTDPAQASISKVHPAHLANKTFSLPSPKTFLSLHLPRLGHSLSLISMLGTTRLIFLLLLQLLTMKLLHSRAL